MIELLKMFENIPKPIFIISTTAKIEILGKKIEKDNLMALDWFTPISKEPAMCAIAIKKTRFTYAMIKSSGVFTLNLMPASKKKAIIYCGAQSGEFIDKFEKSGLNKIESESIHCCAVKESILRYECEVAQEIDCGDHVLIIAKISHYTESIEESKNKSSAKNSPILHYKKEYSSMDMTFNR